MEPVDEALFRLSRAYLNSLTEEFVRTVMIAHRSAFDQGVARARQIQQTFSVPIAALGNDFEIEYSPDGLAWQFLVTPERYLFCLTHMDRWGILKLEGQAWRAVSFDGGPLPEMPVSDFKLAIADVRCVLGNYLRMYQIPFPHDSGFVTHQQS